ncbi:MAG: prepilin-type N-terminal cleavage/methylation domain-containing protein [Sneathiellaceae bacterium]
MAMPGVRRATAPRLRCDAGFTIIEMLVVLTILGLAMAVTPAILAGLDNNRLRAASLELVASMREARGAATRAESPTELRLDLDDRTFSFSADTAAEPLPPVVDRVEVIPGTLVDRDRVARIRFLADGSATSARIVLRNGDLSSTIVVNGLTGRVWRDG